MKQRQKKEEAGSNWMDTYGDMVTLLLCFFVLLYSISSVDQVKWENLVRSLNPDAESPSQIVTPDVPIDAEGEYDVPGENNMSGQEEAFDELYENLIELQNTNPNMSDVEIFEGDGYKFITFRDTVFFDGDSYVLLDEGKLILDGLAEVLINAEDSIKEIRILGHTSQGSPDIPNEISTDRSLSSTRSENVLIYLQELGVPGNLLVNEGYGQHRPIASFETTEGRAQNRRVEMIITENGSVIKELDEYYSQVYGDLEQE